MKRRSGGWESYVESAALAGFGLETDAAVVALQNFCDDAQAQTVAAGGMRWVDAVEHVEDLFLIVRSDSEAVIGDAVY